MKIKLFIFGKERTLLSFHISHQKNTTLDGRPLSFTLGSEKLHISFVQEQGDEQFLQWMLLKDENTQEYGFYERGKIVIYDNSGLDKKLQEYEFQAQPIFYESVFHHERGLIINMVLSANKMLIYNDKFYIKPYFYPKEPTKKVEEKQEESIKCYYTNLEGNQNGQIDIGDDIYLVIESQEMIGKIVDIDLSDNTKDFEYQGKRLENDILRDILIEEDYQKIPLKVVKPQKEAQKQ